MQNVHQGLAISVINPILLVVLAPNFEPFHFLMCHGGFMPHPLPRAIKLTIVVLVIGLIASLAGLTSALAIFISPDGYTWIKNVSVERRDEILAPYATHNTGQSSTFDSWIQLKEPMIHLLFLYL